MKNGAKAVAQTATKITGEVRDAAGKLQQQFMSKYEASPLGNNRGQLVLRQGEDVAVDVSKTVASRRPVRAGDVTTYEDFVDRSVVGDNLEGHEILQHANIKAKGHATTRLSTDASKQNPVVVLEQTQHKVVNRLQRPLDAANQTARQNIEANARILREQGFFSRATINRAIKKAVKHAQKIGEM